MFELELSTDNSSFDEPAGEFARIFVNVAARIAAQEFTVGEWNVILDVNGNACGRWRWAP